MGTLAALTNTSGDLMAVSSDKPSRRDDEIVEAIGALLDWTETLSGGITASVRNGHVTLAGTVGFRYQKQAAERAVRRMAGVRGVDNRVVVEKSEAAEHVRNAIKAAIRRRLDQPVEVDAAYDGAR